VVVVVDMGILLPIIIIIIPLIITIIIIIPIVTTMSVPGLPEGLVRALNEQRAAGNRNVANYRVQ